MSAAPFTGLAGARQSPSNPNSKASYQDCIQKAACIAIASFKSRMNANEPTPLYLSSEDLFTEDFSQSILSRRVKKERFYETINERLFAHVFGDRDIEKTNLEGGSIANMAAALVYHIEEECPEAFLPAHLSILKSLLDKPKTSQEWVEKIMKLAPDDSILMQGGWAGTPGHAMLYRFIKCKNQNYDLYIYNTGSGVETFHSLISAGGKRKISPIVYYKDVAPEKLCFPKSDLIEALLWLNDSKKNDIPNKDPALFIYSSLFGHLNENRQVPPQDPIGVITGQRSGTCSYRVLLPLICQFLGDNKKYKIWHFNFQFAVLRSFFEKESDLLKKSEQNRLLLRNAAKNLQLSAAKLLGRKLISKPEAFQVSATCRELIGEIDKLDYNLRQERAEISPIPFRLTVARNPKFLKENLIGIKSKIYIPSDSFNQITTYKPPEATKTAPPPSQFPFFLSKFSKHISIMRATDPQGAVHAIDRFCHCLPFEADYWRQIPEADLDLCLNELDQLANTYSQIALCPKPSFPRQQNTAQSFCIFVHQLALRKDFANLKDFGIDIEAFETAALNPFYVFFEPKDFVRRQEILAYFASLPQKRKLFNLKSQFIDKCLIQSWRHYPETEEPSEHSFFSSVLKDHPLLGEILQKNIKEYKGISEEVVKAATILGESRAFRSPKTSYAYILQSTAILAQLYSPQATLLSDVTGNKKVDLRIEDKNGVVLGSLRIHYDYRDDSDKEAVLFIQGPYLVQKNFSELHRFNKKSDLALVHSSQFKRIAAEIEEESRVLKNPKESNNLFYEKFFQSIQCEETLAPAKLIYHFLERLTSVEDPNNQTLFDLVLFKITKNKNFENAQIFKEIKESENLSEQCAALVRSGLDYYYRKETDRLNVFPALFFVRLALRLAAIENKSPAAVEEMIRLLDVWLAQGSYTPQELAAIHLHRALAYTISIEKTSEPFSINKKEELRQLIISWMITINHDHHPQWKEVEIIEKIKSFLYSNEILFLNLFTRIDDLPLSEILKKMELDDKEHLNWKGDFPTYIATDRSRNFWSINLLTGKIANQYGIVKRGHLEDFTQNQDYSRLFQNERFQLWTVGHISYFTHPDYGRIRIHYSSWNQSLIIQREIEQDQWWQYIAPQDLIKSGIPLVALSDYSHWVPLTSEASRDCPIRFYHLKTKSLEFEINANGEFLHKRAPLLTVYEIEKNEIADFLRFFERPDCLLIQVDQNKQSSLEAITFPRYHSKNGKTLSFSFSDGAMRWSEDRGFSLFQSKYLPQFLGNFSNLLLLENQSGKRKALIPVRKLLQKDGFNRQCFLDVKGKNENESFLSFVSNPQNGIYHYLEFDVQGSELIPYCSEGRLFLAYLYFAQKEYVQAAAIIQTLLPGNSLSALETEILLNILQAAELAADLSPSSGAVRLQAALFLAKKIKRPETFEQAKLLPSLEKSVQSAASDYEKAPAKIPEILRLSNSDWDLLKEIFDTLPMQNNFLRPNQFAQFKIICDPRKQLNFNSIAPFCVNPDTVEQIKWDAQEDPTQSGKGKIAQFFVFFYNKAINCPDEKASLLLANQINIFHCFESEKLPFDRISNENLYAWLHFALRFPRQAPPLPQSNASIKAKIDWIVNLIEIYKRFWEQDNDNFPDPQPMIAASENLRDHSTTLRLDQAAAELSQASSESIGIELLALPKTSELSNMAKAEIISTFPQPRPFEIAPLKFPKTKEFTEEERALFLQAIETEFNAFEKDFLAGKKLNSERFEYRFKSTESLYFLNSNLKAFIQVQSAQLDEYKKLIEALANLKPEDDYFSLMKTLLQEGGYLKQIDIEECVDIFCRQSISRLQKANPHLSAENIKTLMQLTEIYLIDANELAQAKRAKKLLDQIAKEQPNQEQRSALIHQLGVELNAQPQYCPVKYPQMLVFEYRADLRMRKAQVELIERICTLDPQTRLFNDAIVQLMMGGGKTTVIASVVLMLTAEAGRLPIFIAPSAQYESLKKNIGATQKNNFNQTIRPIDLSRSEFTLKNLRWIREELENALALKDPILIKSEKIQALQLEYLFLLNQSIEADASAQKELTDKIAELAKINCLIWKEGRALWDEVDLLMNPTRETNFPIGKGEKLDSEHVDLLKRIFEIFFDETLIIDGCSVPSLMGLKKNQSSFLSTDAFRQKIAPAAAKKLAKIHEELLIVEKWEESFIRYAAGQMQMSRLTQSDREFLSELERRHASLKEEERGAADLICLAKHLFCQVLPLTLQKSAGRHFGRSPNTPSGKVVPFLGVGSPAPTEFGDPWEAAVYQFMTAASKGISETQLELVSSAFSNSAQHFAQKLGVAVDKTPPAIEFLQITNERLSQIKNPAILKRARDYINQDVKKIFWLETQTICECITFYPSYLSSNPQDFSNQFSKGNRIGVTGTPFNFPCYPKSLSENVIFEEGVDGKIVEEMLARAEKGPFSLFTIDTEEVDEILAKGFDLSPKKEIRGIIDASGIFKDFDNEMIAKQIQKFLKNRRSEVDTILFFGKRNARDILPDHLMALRTGADEPIFIGTTRKEELIKLGIAPERYFVFYDERHCEATDIAQIPNAINIMTIDNKITLRSISQGALRLRSYFLGQDILFAVPQAAQKQMIDQGSSIEGIIRTAIKNQATQIARDTFRAYKHRLRASVRQSIIEELLGRTVKDSIALFNQCKEFFISTQSTSLFDQYFQLETLIPPIESLKSHREKWLSLFESRNRNPELLKRVQKETNEILSDAERSRFLPLLVPSSQSQSEELEINIELQQERAVEREQELNIELQKELQRYMNLNDPTVYKETPWSVSLLESKNDFPEISVKYFTQEELSPIFALNHMMCYASKDLYAAPYHRIFSDQILATKNWALTTSTYLPVFHNFQKPAHQILVVVKKNKLYAVLLSIHDAAFFKDYLSKKAPQNMWLIFPDKTEISSHNHVLEKGIDEQLEEVLIEINFFNGNVRYLSSHPDQTAQFFKKDEKLKHCFLQIKVEQDKNQKKIYHESDFLNKPKKQKDKYKIKNKDLLGKEKIPAISPNEVHFITDGALIPYLSTPEQIGNLSDKQIPFISIQQVAMLKEDQLRHLPLNRPDLINAVADEKLSHLTPKQIKKLGKPKVEALNEAAIAELSLDQVPFVANNRLKNLTTAQIQGVSKEQVLHLAAEQLQFLTTPEQIKQIPPDKIPYPRMSESHINHFSDEQIAQIPEASIPTLSPSLIKRLKTPEKVQLLSPSQISHLPASQFHNLNQNQIEGIDLNLVQYIQHNQIQYLKTTNQLDQLNGERLIYITNQQALLMLSNGRDEKIKNTIENLSTDKYKEITQETLIEILPEHNYRHMTSRQIRHRFGGPRNAIPLAFKGIIGMILKIVSLVLLIPFFARSSARIRAIDDQLTAWMRKLFIAIRILKTH